MRHQFYLLSFFGLAAAVAAQEASRTPRGVFGLGWKWELAPTTLRDGYDPKAAKPPKVWTQYGESSFVPSGHVSLVLTSAGHPVLTHVLTAPSDSQGTAVPDYRPVLFTAAGEKVWATMSMGQSRAKIAETRYVFPKQQDPSAIESYALGLLDFDGKRERAKEGETRAKELGAAVLPLPVVGEKFEFELPTLAGDRFRSKEHAGKVIVIDSWATW